VSWVYLGCKLIHIFAITLWVGGPHLALVGVRGELQRGGLEARAALERLQKMTRLFIAAGLTTLASGGAMIALAGGFSHVANRFLVGGALSLLLFVIGGAVVRPTLLGLEAHFAKDGPPPEAAPLVRRFLLAARTEDTLRLVILSLMVLPLF
jgi:hypothetical protein